MARRKKTIETSPETIHTAAASQPIVPTAIAVDRERIASRAYEIYVARGGSHGRDMDDWLAAEAELGRPSQASGRP